MRIAADASQTSEIFVGRFTMVNGETARAPMEMNNDDMSGSPEIKSSLRNGSSYQQQFHGDAHHHVVASNRAENLHALTVQWEGMPLLTQSTRQSIRYSKERKKKQWTWFPSEMEDIDDDEIPDWTPYHVSVRRTHRFSRRPWRRRIFLLMTEPITSIWSAVFFVILIVMIAASNIIMIMQTMERWQFVPDDCISCGGPTYYMFEDDAFEMPQDAPCECPPAPKPIIVAAEDWIVNFMAIEWSLRVLMFEPKPGAPSRYGFCCQWLSFLTEYTTIMDALAIFPYYAERFEKSNGLMSLRLLRLFRVFQLVRLGQYNTTFMSLTHVLTDSLPYIKLLAVALIFGAAFFGSMVYWLEKGEWKYYDKTGSYVFLRLANDGVTEEPSPFTSIPSAFWWFIVTATTVGYGDTVPTTTGGKCVAMVAMLVGVLVIAFPVSVFSDLWSKELKKVGLYEDEDEGDLSERSAPVATEPQRKQAHQASMESIEATEEEEDRKIEFRKSDLRKLAKHMRSIDRSQMRIRDILSKYDIDS